MSIGFIPTSPLILSWKQRRADIGVGEISIAILVRPTEFLIVVTCQLACLGVDKLPIRIGCVLKVNGHRSPWALGGVRAASMD